MPLFQTALDTCLDSPPLGQPLDRANGRRGFGSQTADDPPPATLGEPWKADCGCCDSFSQSTNPASTFELSQCRHCEERLPGPRRGFKIWLPSGSLSPKTAACICTWRVERDWQKRLAKGWRKVGEGLVKGWRRVGEFPCTFQLCNS